MQKENQRIRTQLTEVVEESLKMKGFYEGEMKKLSDVLNNQNNIVVNDEYERNNLYNQLALKDAEINRLSYEVNYG